MGSYFWQVLIPSKNKLFHKTSCLETVKSTTVLASGSHIVCDRCLLLSCVVCDVDNPVTCCMSVTLTNNPVTCFMSRKLTLPRVYYGCRWWVNDGKEWRRWILGWNINEHLFLGPIRVGWGSGQIQRRFSLICVWNSGSRNSIKSRLVCASEACIRFVLNSVSVGSVVKTRRKPEKYRRTQIRPIREICFLSHSSLFSCKCGQSSCLETKEPFKGEKFIYFLEAKLALNLTVDLGVTQPSSGAVCPKVL